MQKQSKFCIFLHCYFLYYKNAQNAKIYRITPKINLQDYKKQKKQKNKSTTEIYMKTYISKTKI